MEKNIHKQLAYFHSKGIDTLSKTYSQCVDEMIDLYQQLLDEKLFYEKENFRNNLLNIKKLQN